VNPLPLILNLSSLPFVCSTESRDNENEPTILGMIRTSLNDNEHCRTSSPSSHTLSALISSQVIKHAPSPPHRYVSHDSPPLKSSWGCWLYSETLSSLRSKGIPYSISSRCQGRADRFALLLIHWGSSAAKGNLVSGELGRDPFYQIPKSKQFFSSFLLAFILRMFILIYDIHDKHLGCDVHH
jgi:hypothetical protein